MRVYFRFDRKLFSNLYRAAWETWREYVESFIPGGSLGAVMSLHTAGTLLEWHPHLHVLALDGAVAEDGSFVELPEIDQELIREFFGEKVFEFLLKKELLDEDTVESMKSWKHSGFHFYAGEPVEAEEKDARLFLGRYLKKPVVSQGRLSVDETTREPAVVYRHPEVNEDGEVRERRFHPLEFLAELSLHVPKVFEQTTRYFGEYSPRTRGKRRREERFLELLENNFEPVRAEEPRARPSSSWARCMKLVFEVNPLLCPRCGSEMKIKSFVTDSREIERLCKHAGVSSWRAPPKFSKRPDDIWCDDSGGFSQVH